MSRTFAYCRVSTTDQITDNQVQEIAAAGFLVTKARTIVETVSGSVAAKERKGFARLLDKMETGDVLIVTKLDRLGRNAMDVRATVEQLEAAGVRVHCLALGGVDLTSPAGKMTMQVINAVVKFERDLLIGRTNSSIKGPRPKERSLADLRRWPRRKKARSCVGRPKVRQLCNLPASSIQRGRPSCGFAQSNDTNPVKRTSLHTNLS